MRAGAYDAEKARARAQLASADLSDPGALRAHLESLELKVAVRRLRSCDVPRAAQLTQKTNQFNLTTRRYTESDVQQFMDSGGWLVAHFSLSGAEPPGEPSPLRTN